MLMHTSPQKICIIGGGDGGCLREVLKHDTVKSVVIVDIDKMVRNSRAVFPAQAEGFKDNRTNFIYDDGYHYLKTCEEKFDIIIVDSYDPQDRCNPLNRMILPGCFDVPFTKWYRSISDRFSNYPWQFFNKYISECHSVLKKRAYICSMRSFPEGICSFLACGAKSDLENFDRNVMKLLQNSAPTTTVISIPEHFCFRNM